MFYKVQNIVISLFIKAKKGKKRNSLLLRWLVRHKPGHQGWEREWDRDREQREIARGGPEDVPS